MQISAKPWGLLLSKRAYDPPGYPSSFLQKHCWELAASPPTRPLHGGSPSHFNTGIKRRSRKRVFNPPARCPSPPPRHPWRAASLLLPLPPTRAELGRRDSPASSNAGLVPSLLVARAASQLGRAGGEPARKARGGGPLRPTRRSARHAAAAATAIAGPPDNKRPAGELGGRKNERKEERERRRAQARVGRARFGLAWPKGGGMEARREARAAGGFERRRGLGRRAAFSGPGRKTVKSARGRGPLSACRVLRAVVGAEVGVLD